MTHRIDPSRPVPIIADLVRVGRARAVDVFELAIERALRAQAALNCFAEIDAGGALAAAAAIDRRREAGEQLDALAGVPVAIKDCTPVAGLGDRFGSHAFANHIAPNDALVVARFRQADAVILGKTTLSEFASSSFCDSPLTAVTRNPWNLDRTPDGSSGGSAALTFASTAARVGRLTHEHNAAPSAP